MQNAVVKLDPRDNVLIALRDLRKDEEITFDGQRYLLPSDVPAKHKFVTETLTLGANVIMYGVLVGKAREPIARGGTVTTRNTSHEAAPYRESSHRAIWDQPNVDKWRLSTFQGYRRTDGQA